MAGSLLGSLEGKSERVTQSTLEIIERHLKRLDHGAYNDAMLNRLHAAHVRSQLISGADLSFYKHELLESEFMDNGMDYDEAHMSALEVYDASNYSLYHPDVVKLYVSEFNNAWLSAWEG